MHRMHKTHVSVSTLLRREKKSGWICPLNWKLNFTRPLIRIDYLSPEPILTVKMFKKI